MLERTDKQKRVKALLIGVFCLSVVLLSFNLNINSKNEIVDSIEEQYAPDITKGSISAYVDTQLEELNQVLYLSDISYSYGKGYGNIVMDKTSSNAKISLLLNGQTTVFDKGIWAHATSTVEYNITDYKDYAYLTTYYGVNTTSGNKGNGVKFYIYTSQDGKVWKLKTEEYPTAMMSSNNAKYVKIDIKDANYIKLYAYDNGGNANDHAVWADAKLIKEDYNEFGTMTIEEYDEIIKEKNESGDTENLDLLLLQRDFVNKAGQYTIKTFITSNEQNKEFFEWFFNNEEVLRLYLVAGKPAGSYLNSLRVFSALMSAHGQDLENESVTQYGTKLKDLYLTMMIASSLEHSGNVYFWANSKELSNAVTRYEIYKELHQNELIICKDFERLTVEEMRWVINTVIDDEEIKWLNNYTRTVKNGATGPYSYIRYTMSYNYTLAKYYSEENRELWDAKYKLSDWGVTYGKPGFPKLWIVFEEGSVCGGLSKTGSCVWGSYKGLPNTCVCQPGHCAYIYCSFNSNGDGVWGLGNDVFGWGQSGKTEHLNVRMMNDWGNSAPGWSASYILLAQAAQNEYEKYERAEQILMLANVYSSDKEKLESLYWKALEAEAINYDAWTGLVNLYLNDSSKTEEEYYILAEKIATTLTFYPRPMYDLLSKLEPKLKSGRYIAQFTTLRNTVLTRAYNCTANDTLQQTAVKQVAQQLLGWYDSNIASFSFDGANAGSIVLASQFGNSDVEWDYSLDGGKTWIETGDKVHKLTKQELESITAENDIKVHIIGLDYDSSNIYTIDIKNSSGLPSTLYANDLENKLIAVTNSVEWRYTEEDEWTSYATSVPDLTGDVSIQVRLGATGVYMPSDVSEYHFTQDDDDQSKSYVSINHLSIEACSSENVRSGRKEFEYASNAIDGNLNTWWHTDRTSTTDQRYIVIKLDEPKYISQIQYTPRKDYIYGLMRNGIVSTSIDGQEWTDVYTITGEVENAKDYSTKTYEFEESVYAQYIKLKCVNSYDNIVSSNKDADWFINAAMINVFEDLTRTIPTAEVEYSRTEPTALPVTVTLVNPSTDITITNNNGKDTYVFTENGEFTFEYVDKNGNKGRTKAVVDWIVDYSLAFDGEDPYTLILSEKYKSYVWQYSIDGGNNWIQASGLVYRLSDEEINSLSAENDFKFRIITTDNPEDSEIITIDIKAASGLPPNLYANDLENRIIGITDNMEWRIVGEPDWTSYKEKPPNLNGNKTVEVRVRAHGTTLSSNSQEFTFTLNDNDFGTKEYVSVDHLSVVDYSSQGVRPERNEYEYATNAIDGSLYTWWHTNHAVTNDERYITIKLDKPMYISQVQYVPRQNYIYGILKNGMIFASLDGENWTGVYEIRNAGANYDTKTFEFEEPIYTQYIRLQCTNSYDGQLSTNPKSDWFINAAMINLFQDVTKEEDIEIEVQYDIKELTNLSVTATVVCLNDDITVINNFGSDTYIFNRNGEFTFEYIDSRGRDGIVVAAVDWIDKDPPTAEVQYSTKEPTKDNITATIKFSEEVEILNDITYEKDQDGNIVISVENNVGMCLNVKDKAGNESCIEILVDWIDRETPEANVTYSINQLTNKDVVASLEFNEDVTIENKDVTIIKNTDRSYTIVFEKNANYNIEFADKAGNKGTVQLGVDWIDKTVPTANIEYSTKDVTEASVTATLKPSEDVTITNNDGKDTYTFDKNGEFTFEFVDKAGNIGEATAIVNWIREAPVVSLSYSNEKITNQDVVVTLESNKNITITNNDGKNTYTFDKNGEFTFEYVDEYGVKGEITAVVNCIDKESPTAEFEYSTEEVTLNPVLVTLKPSEKVTITNNNGIDTYIFNENGEFTFEFVDEAGNVGYATATVGNIRKIPGINLIYDILELTNQNVTVTLESDKEITITSNDGNNTYTFEENGEFTFKYVDEYGVEEEVTAKVDWIDKTAPTVNVEYSTTKKTNKDVVSTLTFSEKVIILEGQNYIIENEDGTYKVTFTSNDRRIIRFKDEAGNESQVELAVDWIDKEAPTAEFEYSTTSITTGSVTVKLKPSKLVTITNNNGSDTYTFDKNGDFTFEFVDEYGNESSAKVSVNWIVEKTQVWLEYSTTQKTNKDVLVKIISGSNIKIVNNNGSDTYTFSKNGEFTFEYIDEHGYFGTITAMVNWIDKKVPKAEVAYSTDKKTNKNVLATISFNKNVIITNENELPIQKQQDNSYIITFDKNRTYVVYYKDEFGNESCTEVKVDWIDKETPKVQVKYSTTELTNKNVVAILTFDKDVTILNDDVKVERQEDGSYKVVFEENKGYKIIFVDEAGNEGNVEISVNCIDKRIPTVKVEYSMTDITNKDVVATLTFDKDVTILNEDVKAERQEDGSYKIVFTQNKKYLINFKDMAGNVNQTEVIVECIDKTMPTAVVEYSTKNKTKGKVIATIRFSESVEISNNNLPIEKQADGSYTITFTKNNKYTVKFKDDAGNESSVEVAVNWILKTETGSVVIDQKPTIPNKTEETNKDNQVFNGITNGYIYDTNVSVNGEQNDNDKSKLEDTARKEYSYSDNGVTVKILSNAKIEKTTLINKKLQISKTLQDMVGAQSEYFELYLQNEDSKVVKVDSQKFEITLKLDENKKFLGIYKVDGNKSLTGLNYKLLDNNEISVEAKSLGEFIISYDKVVADNNSEIKQVDLIKVETNNKTNTSTPQENVTRNYIIVTIGLTIVLGVVYLVYKKSKKKSKDSEYFKY